MIFDIFNIQTADIFSPVNWFLIAIALIWLGIAVVQDFRHREVENWWSFSLIAFALAFRAFLSAEAGDSRYLLWGLIGLAVGFGLMNALYYGRMFAGGDAKLLMALGVILPLSLSWQTNLFILIGFLILMIFGGAAYGFIYSIIIAIMKFKELKKEFSRQFMKYRKAIYYIYGAGLLALILFLFISFSLGVILVLIILIMIFLFIFAKAIEEVDMKKFVNAKELTIGDWLAVSIKVKGRKIKPYWEGLSESELKFIQKHYKKKVLVKYGIPFTPAFLIGFIFLLIVLSKGFLFFI